MIEYIHMLDTSVLHAIQSIGGSWYNTAWFLSFVVGSTKWLAPAAIISLLLIGKKRAALEILVVFVVSAAVLMSLKFMIDAPRPYEVDHSVTQYAVESDSGMPSGHALISIVILGWLWFRHPKSKILSLGVPAIVILVGLSRVFLGVHYPSQVLVGWVIGLILLCIFAWADKIYFRPRSSYVSKEKRR